MGAAVIHQDNQAAMLLSKNGRASSRKRTKHISLQYFFAKDRIESGDIVIQYCNTQDMIADYMTKPLQGRLFYKMRNKIMNLSPDDPFYVDTSDLGSVLMNDMVTKMTTGPKSFTIVRIFWFKNLLLSKAVTAMVDQKVVSAMPSATNGVVRFIGSA